MTDFLLIALSFILFMSHLYRDFNEKKKQDREDQIYLQRKQLLYLSKKFDLACEKIAEKRFSDLSELVTRYTRYDIPSYVSTRISFILDGYRKEIADLEHEYIDDFSKIYSVGKDNYADQLPDYLIDEYMENVKQISRRYEFIYSLMIKQAKQLD